MTPEEIEQLGKVITDAIDSRGFSSGGSTSGSSGSSSSGFDIAKFAKSFDRFDKSLKKSSYEVDQLNKAIEEVDKALENHGDTIDGEILHSKKKMLTEQKAMKLAEESATNFSKNLSTAGKMMTPVTSGIGGAIKSVTDGASATATASGVMNAGVDAIGGTAKAASEGITKVGVAMSAVNPAIGGVVAGLGVLGGVLSDTLSKAAKFANDILSKEVEKTVKAYNQAATSGALFADGITGLRNAASGAGLTVTQFSDVINKNKSLLGSTGLGVAEAAKQIGRVGESMKKSGLQDRLLRMGYGFEEQAEVTAQVTSDLKRLTTSGTVSDEAVKKGVEDYAQNLRTLSQLTGEDAKAKAEKLRQENTEASWMMKMAELGPQQAKALEDAMLGMSELEKKAFKEQMVIGAVVSKDANIYMANSANARRKHLDLMEMANSRQLTLDKQKELNVKYAEGISNDITVGMKGLAPALAVGGNSLDGMNKSLAEQKLYTDKFTKEGIAAAAEAQKKVQKPGDKLQEGVMGAASAHQALQVQIQSKLLPVMGEYAELTKDVVKGLSELLKTIGLRTDEEREQQSIAKAKEEKRSEQYENVNGVDWEKWRDQQFAANSKNGQGGMTEWLSKTLGTGKYNKESYIDHKEQMASINNKEAAKLNTDALSDIPVNPGPGNAMGGIASGPKSGFYELLHGIEAIVPLPDGKTLPVSVNVDANSTANTASTKNQIESANILTVNTQLLSEQVDLMKQFIRKADDLISVASDHKDISGSILQSSY
jgi:hypothetical protein